MFRKGLILGIDKVDAPEENEVSFLSGIHKTVLARNSEKASACWIGQC